MPSDLKIDYIEMPAADFAAARSFYSAIFDWVFQDYGPEYLAFSDGKMDGGFYKSDKESRAEGGAALVIFYAEDLEGVRDAVVDYGGTIHKDIFSFPGGRRFHFLDPNGNELAVWSDQ